MESNKPNDWVEFFKSRGIKEELIEKYKAYITPLLTKKVPIIFDKEHLALLLGVDFNYLQSVIYGTDSHYRSFKIKKKTGGMRTIDVPYPALLTCQKWINTNILSKLDVHGSAYGYVKKKSIKLNAQQHLSANYMLKLDLKNFFPSISFKQVYNVFRGIGYSNKVSYNLASLCTCYGALIQGAATSPTLSNIILKQLDMQLYVIAKEHQCKYTRYSDDIVISSKYIIEEKFVKSIINTIEAFGLKINKKKTKVITENQTKIVTGLILDKTSKKVRISKKYKKKINSEIYFIKKYGLFSHMKQLNIKNPNYIDTLIGKVNYWLSIEPDCPNGKNQLLYLKTLI